MLGLARDEHRPYDAVDQHDPNPRDRRRPESELRTSRTAARLRTDGVRVVAAPPEARPARADLVRSRSLRVVGRPRLRVALRDVASHRLRLPDVGSRSSFRQWGTQHAGSPGVASHDRRRGDDRSARSRHRERGRHGDRGALPRDVLQSPRPYDHRSPHLRAGVRRRHDGRHLARSREHRGPPRPRQALLHVRREQRHARRAARSSRWTRTSGRATPGTAGTSSTSRTAITMSTRSTARSPRRMPRRSGRR